MRKLTFSALVAIGSIASALTSAQAGGYRVCPMYPTTQGGQYGQDCAGWARMLKERVYWQNNANTPGALAARGIAPRGRGYVAPIGVIAPYAYGGQRHFNGGGYGYRPVVQQPSVGYRCTVRKNGVIIAQFAGHCPQ